MDLTASDLHPFGSEISEENLVRRFADCRQWEDRLRQVILLAKALPVLPPSLKSADNLLSGCESRVWLGHRQLADGSLHFYADSEGRIVKGLLAIVLTHIEAKKPTDPVLQSPLALFDRLGLREELSISRADGLQAIACRIKAIAAGYG